jgi:hypothetical protein
MQSQLKYQQFVRDCFVTPEFTRKFKEKCIQKPSKTEKSRKT